MNQNLKALIGISGNATCGKDTLCNAIIEVLKQQYKIKSCRSSIAGDQIRKDLKHIFYNKLNLNIHTLTPDVKNMTRPLLVEYGRLMRKFTDGRYFINNFKNLDMIQIIPDIRYAEYEKDELFWLKNEKKGFLIYLERDGIEPANIYEEKNNEIIRASSNIIVKWPTFEQDVIKSNAEIYANWIILEFFQHLSVTKDQSDTVQPLDTSLLT